MSVYFYGCISLDGYLATKDHDLTWLYESGTTESTGYDKFYEQMDIVMMGRKTFNEILKVGKPYQFYPKTKNYVFTSDTTIREEGFEFINQDVVEFIKTLDKNKNIWIAGGNTLVAPLLDHDLFDVMYIQIAPVLLGEGIPLFTQKSQLKRYELKKVHQYDQFAELIYYKK